MIALYRTCLVSFCVQLAIARCGMAAAPDTPKAEGDAASDETANVLKPVVIDPDDPLSAEMSAAETARVNEIVEEVRQLWQRSPRTPLPAELKTQRSTERIGGYNAWVRAQYADAWRVHGKHDPRWDDEAAKLVNDYADRAENRLPQRELVARGRKLLADGCDDPLIRLIIGNSLDLKTGAALYQAIEVLRPALDQLSPDYLPAIAYRVELRYIEASNRAWPNKQAEISGTVERMMGRIVQIFAGPLTHVERRRHLHRFITDMHGALGRYRPILFQKLAAAEGADRWLLQVLLARAQIDLAWQDRGGGWASEVPEKGWQGFEAHLTKARSLLLQAWKEQPELPEAAHFLITVATGGVGGEDARFWFDRAVAVDFDFEAAYRALFWALRPRWGGSHEAMLAFGRECLATKRFDTQVPTQLHRAVCDIISESADPREACAVEGLYEDYLTLLDGLQPFAEGEGGRHNLETIRFCISWLTGHDDEARRLLGKLGDDISLNALGDFHVTLSDCRLGLADGKRAPPGERWGERFSQSDIERIRFAPDAKRLIAFGSAFGVRAFDLSSGGQPIFDLPRLVENKSLRDVDISPDGKLLALILADEAKPKPGGVVVLWDVAEGKVRAQLPIASLFFAYRLRFSADGKRVAAGLTSGGAQVWDVESGQRPSWGSWTQHKGWIEALAFTSDGKRLAASAADWKVTVWDLPASDSTLGAPPTAAAWGPFAGLPRSLAFSPDGRRLAIGHDFCEIWDVEQRKFIRQLPGSLVAWSPDGLTLATGGGELYNAARIWDAETGQERAKLSGGHLHQLTALTYSPNGRRVLSGSADPAGETESVVRCWDAANGDEVFDFSGCLE
jgi:WD40 repeat protein